MDPKTRYRALCEQDNSVPLFLQPWWLDAVCDNDPWDVALASKGQVILAALPYVRRRHRGFDLLLQPELTPFLGPWLGETEAKKANEYSRQKDLFTALIDDLPAYDRYHQNWSPNITNWLPFYWRGFKQSTRYTYALEDLSDEAALWKGLRENVRTDIRKAQNRFGVVVDSDGALEELIRLSDLTFIRQGQPRPYSEEFVNRIDQACAMRDCRRIFIARDAEGRPHAGAYVVWDRHSAYYLLGGGDPELRNSGATSLCIWAAIQFAAGVSRRFDFEGSMIEPIERFFRAFGAKQVPYFSVSRTQSRLLASLQALRSLAARL